MLEQKLKKLGLNEKEVKIYLTILEQEKISAHRIAKLTNINRTTVYSVLKGLISLGIVDEDLGAATRYYMVSNIHDLRKIYNREESALNQKKILIDSLISELSDIPKSKNYSVPKIKFYDEIRLEDALYSQMKKWNESGIKINEPSWWGFEEASWVNIFPQWRKNYWESAPKTIIARFLTNDKFKTKQEEYTERQVRYIPSKNHNFTCTQAIIGDYVVFIMTSEKPYYMIEIHDRVIAHNMREVFKLLWEKLD
ncbi:hypothetical protein H6776_00720 [Candidatus Nomurabacteria bacterium]|nr:hypothetical protein [Candidatus Nomurabacteria bacterium]